MMPETLTDLFHPATDFALAAWAFVAICHYLIRRPLMNVVQTWRRKEETSASAQPHPLSVVMVCHDRANELEENLPQLLNQDFPRYEVIVVIDDCTDHTTDVLKRLETVYPHLHHTFIPPTARYVSHQKLGITLGVKSARHEWVVLTRAECVPRSNQWLRNLATHFSDDTDIVLGYTTYLHDHTLRTRRLIYRRMTQMLKWFHAARTKAIGGDGCNMAFRRSLFLKRKGYAGNLNLLCGADDLLVEKLATRGRTAVCTQREATIGQAVEPLREFRRKERLFHMEARKHLSRRNRMRLFRWTFMNLLYLLFWLMAMALIVWTILMQQWAELGATFLVLIVYVVAEHMSFRRVARLLDEPVRAVVFHLLADALTAPMWKMRSFAHRKDFQRSIRTRI